MKIKNKLLTVILPSILILIFFILIIFVKKDLLITFDEGIYKLFYHNDFLTKVMKFITFFGETMTLLILYVELFLIIRNKRLSIFIPMNLMLIGATNFILKVLIQRPRPVNRLIEVSGYSFPSGHTASSLAYYGFLIFII